MLVLSRKLNEKIVLPGLHVAVQVVGIRPGVVRLGIEAPPEVTVMREEVLVRGGDTAPPPARPGKQPKALIVEDNADERELLARCLRLNGLDVDTAEDGGEALDYLRQRGQPDVLLLDMGLPRCDGPEVVRRLRRDQAYAGLRIFAVSGRRPEECGLDRGPAGVDRWFCKPVDLVALVRDLNEE